MLKSLYLENFKCFKKPTRIKFGAITLLYGKNSSGKSTSVKAAFWLPNIREAIANHDYQHEMLLLLFKRRKDYEEDEKERLRRVLPLANLVRNRQSPLDLGDFKDLKNTKSKVLKIGIESTCGSFKECFFPSNEVHYQIHETKKIIPSWTKNYGQCLIQSFEYLDNEHRKVVSAKLSCIDQNLKTQSKFNYQAECEISSNFFKDIDAKIIKFCNEPKIFKFFKDNLIESHRNRDKWLYGETYKEYPQIKHEEEGREYLHEEGLEEDFDDKAPTLSEDFINRLCQVNPENFGSLFNFIINENFTEEPIFDTGLFLPNEGGWIDGKKKSGFFPKENNIIDTNIYPSLEDLMGINSPSFNFIPISFKRKRYYLIEEIYEHSNISSSRTNASKFLRITENKKEVERINSMLDSLDLGYNVVMFDASVHKIYFEILIYDKKLNREINIVDVGHGIIHTIFTIALLNSAKNGDCVFLEEPEAHCHPDLQGRLAYLFAKIANDKGVQIILDTHSEIFTRAFGYFLRNKEFKRLEESSQPSVVLNYFKNEDSKLGAEVQSVALDKTGDFVDEKGQPTCWPAPEGFFTHRYEFE